MKNVKERVAPSPFAGVRVFVLTVQTEVFVLRRAVRPPPPVAVQQVRLPLRCEQSRDKINTLYNRYFCVGRVAQSV